MEPKKRILIVEDEVLICRSLARQLRGDYEVLIANDGAEAMQWLQEGRRFDVILCDLNMPHVGGQALLDCLLQLDPAQAARMIFLTGDVLSESAQQLFGRASHVVLEKPCRAGVLKFALQRTAS